MQTLNIDKMAILLKLIYRCNAISIKIPTPFFAQIDKHHLKMIWKFMGPRIAKIILEKKNIVGRHTFHTEILPERYSNKNSVILES